MGGLIKESSGDTIEEVKILAAVFLLVAGAALVSLFLWKPATKAAISSETAEKVSDEPQSAKDRRPEVEAEASSVDSQSSQSQTGERVIAREKKNRLADRVEVLRSERQNVDKIQAELDALPISAEYAAARTVLLNAASTLPLDDDDIADQVHDMALQELFDFTPGGDQENSSGLQSFSYFLPVLAHELLLRTSMDYSEAIVVTVEGVAFHRDPAIRQSLIRQFVKYYPAEETLLKDQLSERDLLNASSSANAALEKQ